MSLRFLSDDFNIVDGPDLLKETPQFVLCNARRNVVDNQVAGVQVTVVATYRFATWLGIIMELLTGWRCSSYSRRYLQISYLVVRVGIINWFWEWGASRKSIQKYKAYNYNNTDKGNFVIKTGREENYGPSVDYNAERIKSLFQSVMPQKVNLWQRSSKYVKYVKNFQNINQN